MPTTTPKPSTTTPKPSTTTPRLSSTTPRLSSTTPKPTIIGVRDIISSPAPPSFFGDNIDTTRSCPTFTPGTPCPTFTTGPPLTTAAPVLQREQINYYNDVVRENNVLQQAIDEMTTNFSTYDQQAIYQQQQLDTLMNINFWMWITYYFKVVIVIYYLFRMPSDFTFIFKIVFTIFILILPYIMGIIEYYAWRTISYTWSVINTDIYSQPFMKKPF